MAILRIGLSAALAILGAAALFGAEGDEPLEAPSHPPVRISFTPPDLDGRIILGIFDASGKPVRTLHPEPASNDLVIGLDGYITDWDGLDDAGHRCPAGKYSARGYIFGDDVTIEGVAFYFNDWMAEDQVPARSVSILPESDAGSKKILVETGAGERLATLTADGVLSWVDGGGNPSSPPTPSRPTEGELFSTPGAGDTRWVIVRDDAQNLVAQLGADGEALRRLVTPIDEPQPVELAAFPDDAAIMVKDASPDGGIRLRVLKKGSTTEESDGRVVSDWEVVFERSIQPCADFGVESGRPTPVAASPADQPEIEVGLIPNALEPGRRTLLMRAVAAATGSRIESPEGLPLLPVSEEGGWSRFFLLPGGEAGEATLYQGDGVVVEEFSITNLDHVASYDAGSFLLAGEE